MGGDVDATDPMARCKDAGVGWRDEGLFPVSLLVLGYAGVLVPAPVWALMGVCMVLLGALVTVAMWQGAALHDHEPSPATRWAVRMLEVVALWALLGRALVGWLFN